MKPLLLLPSLLHPFTTVWLVFFCCCCCSIGPSSFFAFCTASNGKRSRDGSAAEEAPPAGAGERGTSPLPHPLPPIDNNTGRSTSDANHHPSAASAADQHQVPQRNNHFDDDDDDGHLQQHGGAGAVCMLERDRSAVYLSIVENTKKGSILGTLPIIGTTAGGPKLSRIKLTVVKGREFVRLNALNKQLILRKQIDREQKGMDKFEVIVECVPLATMAQNMDIFPLNISVFVTVADQNDNAPQFALRHQQRQKGSSSVLARFEVQIVEELPEGTPIKLDFGATDADQPGPNSRIRYRIVCRHRRQTAAAADAEDEMGGEEDQKMRWQNDEKDERWQNDGKDDGHTTMTMAPAPSHDQLVPFELDYNEFEERSECCWCCCSSLNIPDPFRPEIFVAERIDFETTPMFSVFIEAEDQGTPRRRTMARLDVQVMDADDLNPIFGALMYKSSEHRGFVLDIKPTPIRAWDADHSLDEPIVYTLSGENSLSYAIDELSGEVKLLDDKLVPATLIVQARQANRPERNATAFLSVQPPPLGGGSEGEQKGAAEGRNHGKEFVLLRLPSNTAIGTRLLQLVGENDVTSTAAVVAPEEQGQLKMEVLEPKEHQPGRMVPSPLFVDVPTKWLRLRTRLRSGEYEENVLIKMTSSTRPPTIRSLHIRLSVFDPTTANVAAAADWAQFGFEKQIYEFELPAADERGRESGRGLVEIGQIRAKNRDGTTTPGATTIEWQNRTAKTTTEEEEDVEADKALVTYALLNGNDLFSIGPTDGVLRVRNPSKLWPTTTTTTTQMVELVAMAQSANGRRDFSRCIVRRRALLANHVKDRRKEDPILEVPGAALCLGLLCFLLLLSNCATLSLWLAKRRMATMYEQLAAYRYNSMMGLAGEMQQQQQLNGTSGCGGWMMNSRSLGDPAVTIANWVEGKMTTWASSTAELESVPSGREKREKTPT